MQRRVQDSLCANGHGSAKLVLGTAFFELVRLPELKCVSCGKRHAVDAELWSAVAQQIKAGAGKLSIDIVKLSPEVIVTRAFFDAYGTAQVDYSLDASKASLMANTAYLQNGRNFLDELVQWTRHNDSSSGQAQLQLLLQLRSLPVVRIALLPLCCTFCKSARQ